MKSLQLQMFSFMSPISPKSAVVFPPSSSHLLTKFVKSFNSLIWVSTVSSLGPVAAKLCFDFSNTRQIGNRETALWSRIVNSSIKEDNLIYFSEIAVIVP